MVKWTGANTVSTGELTDDGTNINILRQIYLSGVSETITNVALSAGVATLNLNTASVFCINLNANISSFTLTNVNLNTSRANTFTIILKCASVARTVNFTFNHDTLSKTVRWPSGTAPTITTGSTKYDVFSFLLDYNVSEDWFGFIGGQNFS